MNIREWVEFYLTNSVEAKAMLGEKEQIPYADKMKIADEIVYKVTHFEGGVLNVNVMLIDPLCALYTVNALTDIDVDFDNWAAEYDALESKNAVVLYQYIDMEYDKLHYLVVRVLSEKREQHSMSASIIRLLDSFKPMVTELQDKLLNFDLGYSAEDLSKVIDIASRMK